MNRNDLFRSMAGIDEDILARSEQATGRKTVWPKWAAMAACLCLILFGMHRLMPTRTPGDPGSIEDMASNDRLEDPQEQESNHSNLVDPGDCPAGEIPNVILHVEEMTAEGFIATVTDYGVTDQLGLGTRLNIVIGEGTRSNADLEDNATAHDSKTDFTGRYVVIQFYDFDPDTGTIIIDSFDIMDEEG